MAEIQENNIPKVYDPKSFETKWYSYWEKRKGNCVNKKGAVNK